MGQIHSFFFCSTSVTWLFLALSGKVWDFTLESQKLACHNFMDDDRRHETPGWETKDY